MKIAYLCFFQVESSVDKTAKSLSEWRQAEAKSKKTSFMCARDNEKLQDAMVEGRQSTRGSSLHLHHAVHNKMSEKDAAKVITMKYRQKSVPQNFIYLFMELVDVLL